ncbi:hypothetical protein LCD52_13030 [Rossellomorea vietnamensis]|uniref:hypothetical protein n=1 Tax=Rossellomorea vietnamensis TaxID=218284 RepID=UPI001CCA803B|nr:hypothetical protein [Rossellomorea vietnamensis]MCA0149717.1 hypothetical protein [Rossellomorea vietnamensis]
MSDREDKELDKRSKQKAGDNMKVMEKELKDMQKQKNKDMTMKDLKKALIKESIRNNDEALQRLSRT